MSQEISFEEVKKEVKKIISEITEIPETDLKEDAEFTKDLGIDSMQALEMVAAIEKRYRIAIPEEEIPNIRSLQNIYGILEKILKK